MIGRLEKLVYATPITVSTSTRKNGRSLIQKLGWRVFFTTALSTEGEDIIASPVDESDHQKPRHQTQALRRPRAMAIHASPVSPSPSRKSKAISISCSC